MSATSQAQQRWMYQLSQHSDTWRREFFNQEQPQNRPRIKQLRRVNSQQVVKSCTLEVISLMLTD